MLVYHICSMSGRARHGTGVEVYGELALREHAFIGVLVRDPGEQGSAIVFELLPACTTSIGTIAKCLFHPNPGRFFCLLRQIQRSSAISRIASERVQTDDDAGSEFCYDG